MTSVENIAARFARETAEHQMTVLHDECLYRHLRFRNPKHGLYWFDLITVPGTLIFRGDGESFVFNRTEDMFEFFRSSAYKGEPNVSYWAEKLTSGRAVMVYDQDLLQKHVDDLAAEAIEDEAKETVATEDRVLTGLAEAIREQITDELTGDESLDRDLVERFRYWANPTDEFKISRKAPDFEFHDSWEWNCRDYDWWFLWTCHAIVWGIAQYDKAAQEAAVA